jgi:hypothetical protein
VAIAEHSVLANDLNGTVERDRVDVRAEEDGPGALRPRNPGEQVARAGARLLGGVVLLDLEAQTAQLLGDGVGHGPLAAGRALYLTEPHELGDEPLAFLARCLDDHCAKATRPGCGWARRRSPGWAGALRR